MNERRDYTEPSLDIHDLAQDPVVQLRRWLEEASQVDQGVEPSAAVLSTVDPQGRPSARTVLLREIRNDRLFFFTNYGSRKGGHLRHNPNVSLLFRWGWPLRQIEVLGTATMAPPEVSDAYFATRPRDSQLAAHASPQSAPVKDRAALESRVEEMEGRFAGRAVPRPEGWGGYVVTPRQYEFWQGRHGRLHDRFAYTWIDRRWRVTRLGP